MVFATEQDGLCRATVEERVYAFPAEQAGLEARFRELAARDAFVLLRADAASVTYRCISGLITLAQEAGLRVGVAFEPAPQP